MFEIPNQCHFLKVFLVEELSSWKVYHLLGLGGPKFVQNGLRVAFGWMVFLLNRCAYN